METQEFTEKLRFFLKSKNIKQKELADMVGVSAVTISNLLSGRDNFGAKAAAKWSEVLGLNPLWLLTHGNKGEMIIEDKAPSIVSTPQNDDIIMVPVINLDVRGGLVFNNETDVSQYVTDLMPFSRSIACEGDVVVPVYGDSMSPRYPSGSHILIRPLPLWREWLELGQSYVLELSDWRRTIKIVRKGSTNDSYRLECYNIDYDTTEIPKSLIEHIWQVLMCVKREVM
ncbi:MAG: helix-turn-helix transcriptional regulator [Muribaculaceae bacterium]|nr:helix-turn-helix transcriptional regulator [Muribaculaceae bacterium]